MSKIIIPGQPPKKPESIFSQALVKRQIENLLQGSRVFEAHRKITALRESCGVKNEGVFKWKIE